MYLIRTNFPACSRETWKSVGARNKSAQKFPIFAHTKCARTYEVRSRIRSARKLVRGKMGTNKVYAFSHLSHDLRQPCPFGIHTRFKRIFNNAAKSSMPRKEAVCYTVTEMVQLCHSFRTINCFWGERGGGEGAKNHQGFSSLWKRLDRNQKFRVLRGFSSSIAIAPERWVQEK